MPLFQITSSLSWLLLSHWSIIIVTVWKTQHRRHSKFNTRRVVVHNTCGQPATHTETHTHAHSHMCTFDSHRDLSSLAWRQNRSIQGFLDYGSKTINLSPPLEKAFLKCIILQKWRWVQQVWWNLTTHLCCHLTTCNQAFKISILKDSVANTSNLINRMKTVYVILHVF